MTGLRLLEPAEVLGMSMRAQWADMLASPLVYLLGIVQPAVFLLITLSPQDDPSAAEATRVAFGVLLTAFWGATVWGGAGVLRRERMQGTLARTLSGVRDPQLVVLGKSLGASLISAGLVAATLVAVLAALRQPVQLAGAGWLLLGLVVVLLSGTGAGMLLGCLFILSRYGPQLSSALMYPIYLLGGMLIPPDLLPEWLRWLSAAISLRWLQEFLVSAAAGRPNEAALITAVLLTALYTVVGVRLFRRLTDFARRQGSLDLY